MNNIRFTGKRSVNWDNVKEYLKTFVGKNYKVEDMDDIIYIGNDLPNEYTGSVYTYKLKGTATKIKSERYTGIARNDKDCYWQAFS